MKKKNLSFSGAVVHGINLEVVVVVVIAKFFIETLCTLSYSCEHSRDDFS